MSQSQLQAAFDTGIWYAISLWPALTVAVQNNWGGPTSADKRDWFAGAISDLFTERPDTDSIDVEAVLLQVMQDEFDVNVEDESEVPIAAEILRLKRQIVEDGDVSGVQALKERFERRGGKVEKVNVVQNRGEDDDDDEDSEDDDEDIDEDMDMDDAPSLVPVKEKVEPEVDEDGFTKVVGKKRR